MHTKKKDIFALTQEEQKDTSAPEKKLDSHDQSQPSPSDAVSSDKKIESLDKIDAWSMQSLRQDQMSLRMSCDIQDLKHKRPPSQFRQYKCSAEENLMAG